MGLFSKIFGTNSQRQIKALEGIADQVDALEEEYKKKTDAELKAKTRELQERYQQGEDLDALLE